MVVGELKNNKLIYKTINSCISFLPTIHSRELIVIEDLVDIGIYDCEKFYPSFQMTLWENCKPTIALDTCMLETKGTA